MRRGVPGWLWVAWLAVAGLATGAYFLLLHGVVQSALYDAVGLFAGTAIIVGTRLHRPARPGAWYWFAAGQIVWVVGDATYSYFRYALNQEPFPSVADVFYLLAYPLLIAGFFVLVRGRTRRDVAGLVDASIIGTGAGLVFWVFVITPITHDTTLSTAELLIAVAYPSADALMLAMLARLWTTPGAKEPSFRLLLAAGLLLLAADVGFSVVTSASSYDVGWLDAGWLLSYATWGAAALHPSMRVLSDQRASGDTGRVTRSRLGLLSASSLLAPGVLFVQGITTPTAVDWLAIGVAAVVLFVLVLARMSGFVRRVQEQADQLNALAMQDPLTGLANRRRFEERLAAALTGTPQVALIDLDDFKAVNDRLGHAVGDQLLQVVAGRLAGLMRPSDTAARLGGDEFAILLPDTTNAVADGIAAQIAVALQQPVHAGEHMLLMSGSVGVVDAADCDPVEVMRRADVAMYAAKGTGSRQLRYEPVMDERATEEAQMGAQLRLGLDEGQFCLFYQPIVALPYGSIVGVEALARWFHPYAGQVNPEDFIPVAERNGLIIEMGSWILRTACAQAAAWRSELGAAAPQKMSVNVSARQLAEPGFADLVAEVLVETGLPPACLAVEVTETAVFNGGPALDALHEIHNLGVQIALDDFGTGHSSLRLLQTVPVDILKVDRSFVEKITQAGRNAVIARALIDVSDGLNLVAVAEGVETPEQAAELYRLGYRFAQGFHFGRPVLQPDFTGAGTIVPAPVPLSRV